MASNAGTPIAAEILKKWIPRIERAAGTERTRSAGFIKIFLIVSNVRTG
jgi:hypothetical protein